MIPTLLLLLAACTGADAPPTAVPGRVDAVLAPPPDPDAVALFCDVHASAAEAVPLVLPPLASPAPPQKGWRWVNVWATWCGPCIEEMPMLLDWQRDLASGPTPVDLLFLSIDAGQQEVDRFRVKHPELPVGLRIAGEDAIRPWIEQLGLPASVAIPLHLFVDPEGRTRCVRAGALSATDRPVVERVLAGE